MGLQDRLKVGAEQQQEQQRNGGFEDQGPSDGARGAAGAAPGRS